MLNKILLTLIFISLHIHAESITKCVDGWKATQSGNHLTAISLFNECINEGELSTTSLARTYRNIGIAYRRAKDPKKAIEAYNKAISLNPTDIVSDYINRANAYDEAGQYDEAMNDYNIALELNPTFGEIYYNRGITYEHQNMSDKAKQEFITAYNNGLRSTLLYERLITYGLIQKK